MVLKLRWAYNSAFVVLSTYLAWHILRRIITTRLFVMLNLSPARLSTKPSFPGLAWNFNPTNTSKGDSFFVEWRKFYIFSLHFFFTLLKRKSCAILVDILGRLVDKLWLKSLPSNIILINLISISRIDCTCFSIETSLSKHSSFSNDLILIALAVLEKTWSWSSLDHVRSITCPPKFIINSQCYSIPFFATQRPGILSCIFSHTRVAWEFEQKQLH